MAESRRANRNAVFGGKGRFFSVCVVFGVVVLLIGQSGCQQQAGSTKVATSTGAVITLDKTVHDFGEIGPGTSHTGKFKFTNTGTAPLVITQVRSCCGVGTKGVKNGQKYAPGRSGILEVSYTAVPQPGDMKRNLYFYTNDPNQRVVPLTIQAKIMRRVDFEPTSLKLFLKKDNAGAKDITLTSLDGRPFKITSFIATADSITAEVDPAAEGTGFVLKPKANLEKLERNLAGRIRITLTHPECKEVVILYDVLPEYTISPPRLMLFNLVPEEAVRREIYILGNYQDDFEIESVSSQKGFLKLVESKKIRGSASEWLPTLTDDRIVTRHHLVVDITPPPGKSDTVLSDVLEVKIKGGETIPIDCRGYYAGS